MTVKIERYMIKVNDATYTTGSDNRPFDAIIEDVKLLCAMADEQHASIDEAMASAGYEKVIPERSLWSHSGGTSFQRSWVAQPGWGFCRRGE